MKKYYHTVGMLIKEEVMTRDQFCNMILDIFVIVMRDKSKYVETFNKICTVPLAIV